MFVFLFIHIYIMKIILPVIISSSSLISAWKPLREKEMHDFIVGDWISLCVNKLSNQPLHSEEISYFKNRKFLAKRTDKYGIFSYSGKFKIQKDKEGYMLRHSDIFSAHRNIDNNIIKHVNIGAKTIVVSTYKDSQCVMARE